MVTVRFPSGAGVSPQVETAFNCLQTTGDFCPQQPVLAQELARQFRNLTDLQRAVTMQSQGLPDAQMKLVQAWIDQLQQSRNLLEQQLVAAGAQAQASSD